MLEQCHHLWNHTFCCVNSVFRSIRFPEEAKELLNQMMKKDPKERITLEKVQENAWYNKGFDAAAEPTKYAPITVTDKHLEGAVSKAKITEIEKVPVGPPGAPTYVCFVDY